MSALTKNFGIFLVLGKVAPKLIPLMTKLFKGVVSLKAVGGVASLGLYSLLYSWQMAFSLVAFILIHEYGHLRAMQDCGIKTKGIYLIPGFGGAAVAAEGFRSARNEVYIALMGPLVGLIFIIPMIILYFVTQNPMFAAVASVMSLINLFNLFPINPLDGGRVVKGLLYSFHGSVGFFFSFLSFFLAIFLGYKTGLTLLCYVAVIGLMETIRDYGLNDALKRFLSTIYRIMGIVFLYLMIPVLFKPFSWMWLISFLAICLIGIVFYLDVVKTTREAGSSIISYPWIVVKDVFRGLNELVSIKPTDLKRTDVYEPMSGKKAAYYSVAYIVTIIIMVALVIYTADIPGCQFSKEMLM